MIYHSLGRYIVIVALVFAPLFFPIVVRAETIDNLGFLQGFLWYDREPFFAGQTVRVYSLLVNSTDYDLTASVTFYDNGAPISSSPVTLSRHGGSQIVWADWTPRSGDHSVSASITEARVSKPGEVPRAVELARGQVGEPAKFVDSDTDGDGVGDKQDTDDDGDKVPDVVDPLPLVPKGQGNAAALNFADENNNLPSIVRNVENAVETVAQTIQQKVASSAPQTLSFVETALEKVEDFRAAQAANLSSRQKTAAEALDDKILEQSEGKDKDNPSLWPERATMAALTAASFAFDQRLVFYPLLIFLVGYLLIYKLGGFLLGRGV